MNKLLTIYFIFLIAVSCMAQPSVDTVVGYQSVEIGLNKKQRQKIEKWFTGWDLVGYGCAAFGGYVMGLREAFHADPNMFERRWGVSDTHFFGSEGWRRKYHNNDPAQGKKSEWLGNANRDFWHLADKVQRGGLVLGVTLPLVQTKMPIRQRLANAGVSMLIYSFAYTRGYNFRYD